MELMLLPDPAVSNFISGLVKWKVHKMKRPSVENSPFDNLVKLPLGTQSIHYLAAVRQPKHPQRVSVPSL